jgi:hypothetical protein
MKLTSHLHVVVRSIMHEALTLHIIVLFFKKGRFWNAQSDPKFGWRRELVIPIPGKGGSRAAFWCLPSQKYPWHILYVYKVWF